MRGRHQSNLATGVRTVRGIENWSSRSCVKSRASEVDDVFQPLTKTAVLLFCGSAVSGINGRLAPQTSRAERERKDLGACGATPPVEFFGQGRTLLRCRRRLRHAEDDACPPNMQAARSS